MLELSLTIELIVALLVYFFLHFTLIIEIAKKFKLGFMFSQSIILIDIISLVLVLMRLITLTIPSLPFFEQYIIRAIWEPANYLLPDFINPFMKAKALPTFISLMINTFCTILLIYHILAQFILLKSRNIKTISVVLISSLIAYISSIISIIAIHYLMQLICVC